MRTDEQENQFILELIREAGSDNNADGTTTANWTDQQHIDGFRGNYPAEMITAAANGNITALAQLLHDCGLPIIR
jgi:hypothetical protein